MIAPGRPKDSSAQRTVTILLRKRQKMPFQDAAKGAERRFPRDGNGIVKVIRSLLYGQVSVQLPTGSFTVALWAESASCEGKMQ